jgi:hypothetical protein
MVAAKNMPTIKENRFIASNDIVKKLLDIFFLFFIKMPIGNFFNYYG